VPSPGNPQSLNRYAYTANNPLKYTDPTGHGEDCGSTGRDKCKSDPEPKFACVTGYGCFDLGHLRTFPFPKQKDYWGEFKRKADAHEDFSVELGMPEWFGSSLTIRYWVSGKLKSEQQYQGVAMAIFQDYARKFEAFQLVRSNFANQDLPSDYLGLVAAMRGLSPDKILRQLGEVTYTDKEIPPSTLRPGKASNYEFTPKIPDGNGNYHNVPWPAALQVTSIHDATLWRPAQEQSTYGWGAFWTDATYDQNGSVSQFSCTFCSAPW
jgi:hypothetical protein